MRGQRQATRGAEEETGDRGWRPPASRRAIFTHPLPDQRDSPLNRLFCRVLVLLGRKRVLGIRGIEHIASGNDPFVLALNHSQKGEAIFLPAILVFQRGGRLIHFLSDWNFRLVPVLSTILRRAGTITLVQKPARPRFLNVFRRFYAQERTGLGLAVDMLREGRSVGVFPEGTINPDPARLLPGHRGAARISLSSGAPVVPAGIRFPGVPAGRPIPPWEPFEVEIGPPMVPPTTKRPGRASPDEVHAWHDRIMRQIARLSGKQWNPAAGRGAR